MSFIYGLICGIIFISLIAGVVIAVIKHNHKPIGDLRIDHSDRTDAPYLFLELSENASINTIIHRKHVTFRVKLENYISHK